MSLNREEMDQTSRELRENLELSGLTEAAVIADLGFGPEQLRDTLALDVDPASVWLLRDYLQQAVRDAGRQPVPFSVLTDRNRRNARRWFGLREAPRHRFAA